jgi:hypothetical protein
MQAFGRVRKQIAVLMNRAPLHRHTIPDGGDRSLQARRAIDDAFSPSGHSINVWMAETKKDALVVSFQ